MHDDEDANDSKIPGYNPRFLRRVLARRRGGRRAAAGDERAPVRGVPDWVADIVRDAARRHGVEAELVMGRCRRTAVVAARNEAFYRIRRGNERLSFPRIGLWFGRDHTAILFAVASHARRNGLPELTGYDLAAHDAARRRSRQRRSARAGLGGNGAAAGSDRP